ncbi:unnamed protein product [Adineta steineri]|uniref:Uncharacterized protein n=1 Tax=Adineta steineri TaxID=433720 RepID=A0A815Z1H3_9BILA|nr:unnamed protein product [Adineta steineri]CAF1671736.1 unnamed protein product [Adineta steineri]
MTSSNTLLEPIAVIDVGSATTIDRFDLKSFTAHMLNMDNNGQLHQKLLRDDAEPANIDLCHRSLILKFVHLLDGDGYSVEKMSGTKTSMYTG